MPTIVKSLHIEANTPLELFKADRAVQSLVDVSRSQIVGMFDHSCVKVNGAPCLEPWRRLIAGDTVEVRYDSARRYARKKPTVRPLGFEIVFEDEHLIVVNKPADCLTTPSPRRETSTLIDRVTNYLSDVRGGHGRRRSKVFAVSRLDRGVSGVLVFAKSGEAFAHLKRQFAAHTPQREYVAIVAGHLPESEGAFRSYLMTSKSLQRYSITAEWDQEGDMETGEQPQGELAITHYRTQKRLRDATVVRVWLETGRRNQIRVHFAEGGHPVLGDPRYEPELASHARWRAGRIALHALSLEIEHPQTRVKNHFVVDPPDEFVRFIGPR